MGMSTHVVGFIPDTDPTFLKHKKVLEVCFEAKVGLPKETAEYFGESASNYSDVNSILEEKLNANLEEGVHYVEWSDDYGSGYEVLIEKLPVGVTKVRMYNSW